MDKLTQETTIFEEDNQTTQELESDNQTTQELESDKSNKTVSSDEDLNQKDDEELPDDPEALKELIKKTKEEHKKLEKTAKEHQAAFTKKAQELKAIEKAKQQEQYESGKIQVDAKEKEINKTYSEKINTLKNIKAKIISDFTSDLHEAGYNPQQISELMLRKNIELDNEYEQIKTQEDQIYYQTLNQIKQDRNTNLTFEIEQNFSKLEDELKDDIKQPEIAHIIKGFKDKGFTHTEDFKVFYPVLKEALNMQKERLTKELQLNAQRDNVKNKQSGLKTNNVNLPPNDEDDALLDKYLTFRR